MTDSTIHRRATRRALAGGTLASALAAGSALLLVVACGRTSDVEAADGGADAATESSPPATGTPPADMPCVAPPSECLDEHTMKYFTSGTRNDAGTCDFMSFTMKCDPSPVPPDCFQGGCRVVIVR